MADAKQANAVPNEPSTMLNLLKALEGVFGSVDKDDVVSMDAAIIYVADTRYKCYFHPAEASITRPFAHKALAEADAKKPKDFIRAYVIGTNVGKVLFPSVHDLIKKGIPEDGDLEDKVRALRAELVGRAAVELGGISRDGKTSDFVSIALAAQTLLADAHDRGLDFIETERDLNERVLDVVLAV